MGLPASDILLPRSRILFPVDWTEITTTRLHLDETDVRQGRTRNDATVPDVGLPMSGYCRRTMGVEVLVR